jgi:hypothetical protein
LYITKTSVIKKLKTFTHKFLHLFFLKGQAIGWEVQGLNPERGNRLFSKHQTSSEAHPTFYVMYITGNCPWAILERVVGRGIPET